MSDYININLDNYQDLFKKKINMRYYKIFIIFKLTKIIMKIDITSLEAFWHEFKILHLT